MAAEYSANAIQTIESNQNLIFTAAPVACNRGLIFFREESGNFLLANNAPVRNSGCGCGCIGCRRVYETLYRVSFHGNIAVAEGGVAEEIQLALALDGNTEPSSIMRVTPAAVGDFQNVGTEIVVSVPSLCGCESVSVRNISAQAIDVQNANISFDYLGVRRVV